LIFCNELKIVLKGGESVDDLRCIIEDIAVEIAKSAVDMTKHAGRKTVKSEDVKLASKGFSKY